MTLITIIVPCRDEERFIVNCLQSIAAFQLPVAVELEVLVMDGESSDATVAIVNEFARTDSRFRVLANPGRIQSTALNLALRVARGSYIMRLDAHTLYPPDYFLNCYETALRTEADNVGGMCITAVKGDSYQAKLVQAMTTHKFGVGDSGFRTGAAEGPRDTVPFGFFRRELFTRIGGFDQRLVRCQDYEFNRRIIACGGRIWFNPAIRCTYFNQPNLWRFLRKQIVVEAPYNPYMWYLAPYSFSLRHAITAVFAAGVLAGLTLSSFSNWIAWPFTTAMALYGLLAIASATQLAFRYRQPLHVIVLPFCFFSFHFLHGLGVLGGGIRLLTGTAPVQKIPEPWPGAGFRRFSDTSARIQLPPTSP